MYHGRFNKSHYEAGYNWGRLLYERDKHILDNEVPFEISEERKSFARECLKEYKHFYPEILEEIRGLAEGQHIKEEALHTILFGMYCFELSHHCTCFAFKDEKNIIFARNSDFLVYMEKLYMNCLYKLKGAYAFNGNTTAFIQMEDGINEYALAVGLTFVYPKIRKPGLNAGLMVRYLLEKCKSVEEAIEAVKMLPIASTHTLTLLDASGDMAVLECNPERISVIKGENNFAVATNNFVSEEMKEFKNPDIDDWRADERYLVAHKALGNNKGSYSLEFAKDILSGKYGFMCQYDRKKGADTVWSVVYDLKNKEIFRAEGNPSRKKFVSDTRMKFK